MPQHRVKLVDDAVAKAAELGGDVGIGWLATDEQYEAARGDDGYVLVRPREYDRLRVHGLIEDAEMESPGEAEDPSAEETSFRERTLQQRLPTKVTAVHPGGVGHQPNDNYSNQRIQDEVAADQARGLAQQQERGQPNVREQQSEEALRSDHSLPEQEKAFRKAEEKRDKELEKARKDAEKDREKARREHERQEAKDQEKAQKEREDRAVEGEEPHPVEPSQPKGQSKDQTEVKSSSKDDQAEVETTTRTTTKTKPGAVKDKG